MDCILKSMQSTHPQIFLKLKSRGVIQMLSFAAKLSSFYIIKKEAKKSLSKVVLETLK